jgi:uncharacterized membrane protein
VNLRLATLLAATVTTGMAAGAFVLYAHTIMPGLGGTDDRTFVGAFQAMDRAIMNPLFMLTFFGALLLTGAAGLLYLRGDEAGDVVPWVAVAFALYLVVVVITMAVNVPLNDALKAAGDPERIADLAAVRADFHEGRWVAWNVVRAVLSTVAFGCLAWSLVVHGRATGDDGDSAARRPANREAPAWSAAGQAGHGVRS